MKKWIVWCVFMTGLLPFLSSDAAVRKKKPAEIKENLSRYDKLFKGKSCETVTGGFVTVHKVDGKLYLEFPLKFMGRELLLASTTSASTDNTVCTNGYKENTPMHIRFTLKDSSVLLRKINAWVATDSGSERMEQLMQMNFSDPVTASYRVLAYTPDSSAVVFDLTGIFLNEESALSPIPASGGELSVTAVFNKELSSIRGVKSFEDNMSVKSRLVYRYSVSYDKVPLVKDKPLTVEATRVLLLLPESKMKPRISDLRVGTFLTLKRYLTDNGEPVGKYSYANRWQLVPEDEDAYQRGEWTEPVKPIVFYLDTLFPEAWRDPIREGVLKWNRAFEKIGFKNVLQVRDFPVNDPAFDPDNLKYSCIRYVPTGVADAMGPSWVDPSTGEILNASVLIYNDVVQMVKSWRFVQTAQVDPSVRSKWLPEPVWNESLSYVVAHEVGHCLGLMHNMAASSAFPVDSLRSANFTRKYGTTSSIMDYARFNYVAQPGDQGVKLTPPDLGVYDEFVIKWLYTPVYPVATPWDEAEVLEAWVDGKADDRMYRYGRQQLMGRYDPSALEEDLGDDPMKAGDYGIKNLKYILSHLNEWITDDPDAGYRQQLYEQIVTQYYRYIRNVTYQIGGIYLSDAKEGTAYQRYQPVAREVQKASVGWVIARLKDCGWLDDRKVLRKFPLGMAPSPNLLVGMGRQLTSLYKQVTLAASLAGEPYTVEEYFGDLYDGIMEGTIAGRKLTAGDMLLQAQLLNKLSEQINIIGGNRVGLVPGDLSVDMEREYAPSLLDIWCYGLDPTGMTGRYTSEMRRIEYQSEAIHFGNGYGWQRTIDVQALDESSTYYLDMLLKIKYLLESKMKTFDTEDQPHYEAMLFSIKQMLGKQGQNK